jgi:hypothetical protein
MYEIWLALNVLFEVALANLPLILFFLAIWLALTAFVVLRGRASGSALPAALLAWVLAAGAALFGFLLWCSPPSRTCATGWTGPT